VLVWLFGHSDQRYFVRQLSALVKDDSTNVSRELARLEKTGILVSISEGKQKYYQANKDNPLFNELRNLIVKASPVITSSRFPIPRRTLAKFCRKHHIKRLALFGSVLREDFRSESDIDVLVDFEPGYVPGFGIVNVEKELSRLAGRKVDLRTTGDLSRYFRERVVREARLEYSDVR